MVARRTDFDRDAIGRRLLLGESAGRLAAEVTCDPVTVEACALEVLDTVPGFDREQYIEVLAKPGIGPIKAMRALYRKHQAATIADQLRTENDG